MAIKIPVSRKCMIVGCDSLVKANDLCAMHYMRSKRHDGFTGETRPERGTCTIPGCSNPHRAKGMCQMHYYRLERSGTTNDPISAPEKVCDVEGCGKPHVAGGLCQTHYKRMKRHGDVIQTRAADWGSREKNPLYPLWNSMVRTKSNDICDRWKNLWAFVEDIGDSRPSIKHKLARQDVTKPYELGNVYWREQTIRGWGENKKEAARAYAKKYYDTNKRKVWDGDLRKKYGVGADDYERMFEEQSGVCAICHQEETRVDHRTKAVSRLAVDHCHRSNDVRALLCHHCNNALGAFDDNLTDIISAVVYLAKHSKDSVAAITAAISQLQAALPVASTA